MAYESHPLSKQYRAMTEEEYQRLKASVCAQGLLHPVVLYEDKVLDGVHRQKACLEMDLKVDYVTYTGTDPQGFVHAHNEARRHLTVAELALKAAKTVTATHGGDRKSEKIKEPVGSLIPDDEPAEDEVTIEQAAKAHGLGRQTVVRMNKAHKVLGEEAVEELVEQGESVHAIEQQARRAEIKQERNAAREQRAQEVQGQAPELPSQKHRLLYADPPWPYERNVSIDHLHHYPSMTMSELYALDVSAIAENDSVLCMWATAPKLSEGMALMGAWGFEYKTCLVWDKVHGHYGGWYSKTSHEVLLIGTRGNGLETPRVQFMEAGLPDVREVSVYREKRTKHSKKPDYYYGLLERMFGEVTRIELFAREARPGWACWGNEGVSHEPLV